MTPEIEALLREADTVANIADHWAMPAIDGRRLDQIIADLARALRAALADAERYRYLRSWKGQWIVVREEPEDTQLHGDVLDAAIDAARAGKD